MAIYVSASAFLFYALMLSVPRGYSAGAALLLIGGFYMLARAGLPRLDREDKTLIVLLALVSGAGALTTLYHGDPVRNMDLSSRYVLVVPILLLALRTPPRMPWLWAGLVVATVSGAGVALWQLTLAKAERAVGFTGVIQFGDLALMMGVFCLAGQFWAARLTQHKRAWQAALFVGMVAGAYGSLASGSRGGWVAMPVIIVLFCSAMVNRRNIRRGLIAGAAACAALSILAVSVPTVQTRYDAMVSDIQFYKQGNADTSLGARFAIWTAVSTMIPQRPLLGWSLEDYRAELQRQVAEEGAPVVITRLANTHNNYLELWVLQGAVGLLATLALLLGAFVGFCRRLRSSNGRVQALALCGATLVSAYGVFCMSQIMLGRNNTLLFFVVSLALLWGSMRREERLAPS